MFLSVPDRKLGQYTYLRGDLVTLFPKVPESRYVSSRYLTWLYILLINTIIRFYPLKRSLSLGPPPSSFFPVSSLNLSRLWKGRGSAGKEGALLTGSSKHWLTEIRYMGYIAQFGLDCMKSIIGAKGCRAERFLQEKEEAAAAAILSATKLLLRWVELSFLCYYRHESKFQKYF